MEVIGLFNIILNGELVDGGVVSELREIQAIEFVDGDYVVVVISGTNLGGDSANALRAVRFLIFLGYAPNQVLVVLKAVDECVDEALLGGF
jgi:hypothetical protein